MLGIPLKSSRFDGMTIDEIVANLTARVDDLFTRAGVTPEEVLPGGSKRRERLNSVKNGMLSLSEAAANLYWLTQAAASDEPLWISTGDGLKGFWAQPRTRERLAGHDYLCAIHCERAEGILDGSITQ